MARLCTALGLLVLATPLSAQSVPTVHLTGAPKKLEDGFSYIRNIRELSDGRVLMAVSPKPELVVGDFTSGQIEQVGAEGSGPGEYRNIGDLTLLGGDSTLVPGGEGRWIVFDGTDAVHTLRAWSRGFAGMSGTLKGGDRNGHFLEIVETKYGKQANARIYQYSQNAESLAVIVHRRAPLQSSALTVGRPETLAVIRGPFREVRQLVRGSYGGGGVHYTLYTILDGEEQAVIFPDGWVAIAYAKPYRVEWHAPDRRKIVGPPLPFERIPVDQAQKLAAVARDWPRSPTLFKPDEYPPWPDVLPPFQGRALVALSDGRLAIQRTPDAKADVIVYDLVDRTGRLTGRLQLRKNEELKAITEKFAYVQRRDSDDLTWLERYAWPPN